MWIPRACDSRKKAVALGKCLRSKEKPDQHGQLWLKSMLFSSSLPYVLRKHVLCQSMSLTTVSNGTP